jgi:hypothetical protein
MCLATLRYIVQYRTTGKCVDWMVRTTWKILYNNIQSEDYIVWHCPILCTVVTTGHDIVGELRYDDTCYVIDIRRQGYLTFSWCDNVYYEADVVYYEEHYVLYGYASTFWVVACTCLHELANNCQYQVLYPIWWPHGSEWKHKAKEFFPHVKETF